MRLSRHVLIACCGILFALPSIAVGQGTCLAEPTDQSILYADVMTCQNHVGDAGDFFRFQATSGDTVRVVLTELPGGVLGASPCFELFAPSQPPPANPPIFSSCGSTVVAHDRALSETGTYTITVHDFLFDALMNYSIELVCLSGTCANTEAVCDIQLNQTTYFDGDVVTASLFRFANNRANPLATEIKVWLGVPGTAPVRLLNVGADGSVVLPAGFTSDVAPLSLFQVTSGFSRGSYELSCRVLDPVTGRLLGADRNPFIIQ